MVGGDGVLLEILPWVLGAEAHVGVGGEVEDEIAAGHGLGQRRQIEIVALDQAILWVGERPCDKGPLARGEIVPADDGFPVGEEAVNEAAANKAGCAGDEDFVHGAE